jgi:hypothetical protein
MSKAVMLGLILTVQLMYMVACQRLPSATLSGTIQEIYS